jgi:hypothetical protein
MLSKKCILIVILTFPSYVFAQVADQNAASGDEQKANLAVSASDKNKDQTPVEGQHTSTDSPDKDTTNSRAAVKKAKPDTKNNTVFQTMGNHKQKSSAIDSIGRVSLEVLLGLIGNAGIFGSFYANVPGWWHYADICEREGLSDECTMTPGIGTFFIAIPIGFATSFTTPLGVYLGGEITNGNGNYWWTMLGHFTGMAVGCATGYLIMESTLRSSSHELLQPAPMIVATVIQLTGAIVAYELSNKEKEESPKPSSDKAQRGLSVMPVAALTDQGGQLGVAGTF